MKYLFFPLLILAAPAGFAQILAIETRGQGCPMPSTKVVISPDGLSASVLFSQYFAESEFSQKLSRSECQILIELSIPANKSIDDLQLQYFAVMDTHLIGKVSLQTTIKRKTSGEIFDAIDFSIQNIGFRYLTSKTSFKLPTQDQTRCPHPLKFLIQLHSRLRINAETPGDYAQIQDLDISLPLLSNLEHPKCRLPQYRSRCLIHALYGEQNQKTQHRIYSTSHQDFEAKSDARQKAADLCRRLVTRSPTLLKKCQFSCSTTNTGKNRRGLLHKPSKIMSFTPNLEGAPLPEK